MGTETAMDGSAIALDRHREDVFRLLVESVEDYAIFVMDPMGRIVTWNKGAQRIKGYTEDEIVGKHFSLFYPAAERARGVPEQALRIARDEKHWENEGWRVRKDGTQFWASVVITALRDREGELIGFAKVTRDLTSRLEAEQERLQLLENERLAAMRVQERDAFLSVAAHELKTPVTTLRLASQLIEREVRKAGGLSPQMARVLQTMERQSGHLGRLVERLFDRVRIQNGDLSLDVESCDVTDLLEDVVQRLQTTTERHELVVSTPSEALIATVDPHRLEQVVTNLIDNAIKFSPGGGRVDIRLEDVETENAVPVPEGSKTSSLMRLAVRDHGIGVPADRRGRLFERFYQAHDEDYRSGMGLGLFISRNIVERHGGILRAEFPEDGGTRMLVELPLTRGSDG